MSIFRFLIDKINTYTFYAECDANVLEMYAYRNIKNFIGFLLSGSTLKIFLIDFSIKILIRWKLKFYLKS